MTIFNQRERKGDEDFRFTQMFFTMIFVICQSSPFLGYAVCVKKVIFFLNLLFFTSK